MIPSLGPIVCLNCRGPREVESRKPGEIKYAPCAQCGGRGIRHRDDPFHEQETRRKKANHPTYEDSPYRGGKLANRKLAS